MRMRPHLVRPSVLPVVLVVFIGFGPRARGQTPTSGTGLGAWQNPDIGLVYDLQADLHDAERDGDGDGRWTTRGFSMSTAEISLGADVDPYGRIDFNAQFSESGAEIHEVFFLMPALPLNLKLKGGRYLADFGRWSQFHSHFMPFVTEPRILHEYVEGHLSPTGLEMSWLLPLPHYVELTGGIYNSIEGHSHDTGPASESAAWGPDNPPPGCHFHGDELHCPGCPELVDVYNALVGDPEGPSREKTNRGLSDLAFLGRLESSLEPGPSWSIEWGVSIVHQDHFSFSRRFSGQEYSKTTYGADATLFWNPPEKNLYTGLDLGIEFLANREQFEVERDSVFVRQTLRRDGFFAHARYRVNRRWGLGVFGEQFEPRQGPEEKRTRFGGFLTLNISHFQSLTLEISRYDRSAYEDPLHLIMLQYDGTIGYHTHGRQR